MTQLDRAEAALDGLAIGDALGMPTQSMPRAEIARRYGAIDDFLPGAADQPIAPGMPAGSITDDTEQALLVARALIDGGGRLDRPAFARALAAWEDDMRARGSLDLLGPSTKAAVEAVLAGMPVTETGRRGTTNGAAMRIAPVGIATSAHDIAALVDAVEDASAVTHNTSVAIAGAAAVAAAVSVGVSFGDGGGGGGLADAVAAAIEAARIGAGRGAWVATADVARRIEWAVSLARPEDPDASLDDIAELIGTSLATQESVPAAFGILATFPGDPWAACRAAASIGGDTDTIGAMAGAIGGALAGPTGFPAAAIASVRELNGLSLRPIAHDLLALRGSA